MAVPEDCSWLPKYPSRIIGLVLLGASFQPYYASSSFPVPSIAGWTPTYPSRIERKVQHASQKPFLFQAGRIALPSAPVPALAWKAQHPDRIDRRRLPVADQPSVFAVPFSRATQLTQFPSYPSQISRPRIHASQQQFSFFKLEGPPPFLSWKGEQPVAVRRATPVAAQVAFAFYSRPVPAPDPPGLGYTTSLYPNRIYPRVSILTARQQSFAFYAVPIPNLPPPDQLSWQGSFPAFTYRLDRPKTASAIVTAPPVAVPGDLKWAPTYPSFFRRQVRVAHGVVAPLQIGAVIAVAPEMAWTPTYPDQIHRVPLTNSYVGFDPLSIASLLPVPPECVEWTHEDGTRAALITQDLTRASFINEDAAGPDVRLEKSC